MIVKIDKTLFHDLGAELIFTRPQHASSSAELTEPEISYNY